MASIKTNPTTSTADRQDLHTLTVKDAAKARLLEWANEAGFDEREHFPDELAGDDRAVTSSVALEVCAEVGRARLAVEVEAVVAVGAVGAGLHRVDRGAVGGHHVDALVGVP